VKEPFGHHCNHKAERHKPQMRKQRQIATPTVLLLKITSVHYVCGSVVGIGERSADLRIRHALLLAPHSWTACFQLGSQTA
jgi:hypothetical protein